ncbi:glycosyltransferase family 2 protein [Desulfovibrio sp. OttesenSCG-928-M14]|nr:glycosyltransferase family 2 protein [Desulfovibrio sp. OttesenSCG-928-M14]
MNSKPVFSVIIPIFNHWNLTRDCLLSLKEHTPDFDFEVIVIDNGSSDESAAALTPLGESLFGPRFTRLRFEENRNFGPACNAGARVASAPLLFFLNNDTLLTPGWAPPLLAAFERNSRLGAAGPLLLYEDDTVQHMGVVFGLGNVAHLYQYFPKDHTAVKASRVFQALTGAALMMPAKLFADLDGFFEGFINGFEDVDLCLRLGARGLTLRFVPDSVIYHLESRTQGRKGSEVHNIQLLYERQGNNYRPDCHLHGKADGFLPFINDGLDIDLQMTDLDEVRLLKQSRHSPALMYELARANPLWVRGREVLANVLMGQGQKEKALFLYTEILNIQMSVESFDRVIALHEALGMTENIKALKDKAEALRANAANVDKVRRLQRRFAGRGDALLDELLENRLARMLA